MTWYAHRRGDGVIASLHQEMQAGYAEEVLADDHPEVVALLNPPAPVPSAISDRQFAHALAKVPYGLVSYAEALAFVQTGVIPPTLEADILALPPEQQADARLVVCGAVEFWRDHSLMEWFRVRRQWTPAQMDEFFRFAATL